MIVLYNQFTASNSTIGRSGVFADFFIRMEAHQNTRFLVRIYKTASLGFLLLH